MPFRVRGRWGPGEERSGFAPRFRAAGAFYPESATSNADEYFLRLRPGYEWVTGYRRAHRLWFSPVVAYNNEIFFDRFIDSDWAFQTHALAGVELPISPAMGLLFEGRYSWVDDDAGGDFAGLGEIDLGGPSAFVGASFHF